MKSARVLVLLAVALAVATSAGAALIEKEVSYPGDGATLKGFLVWDDSFKGQLPGILVVHDPAHSTGTPQRATCILLSRQVA